MKSIKDKIEKERKWILIDAKDKVLGRLASRIAIILRGKHKEYFVPYWDVGDYVIVINAAGIKVTGNKMKDKLYYRHSGYLGHLKIKNLETMMKNDPAQVIYHAVKGMLPKNKLNAKVIKKLKIYNGSNHPHQAQKPEKVKIL